MRELAQVDTSRGSVRRLGAGASWPPVRLQRLFAVLALGASAVAGPGCSRASKEVTAAPAPKLTPHQDIQSSAKALLLSAAVASAPGMRVDEIILVFATPLDPMSVRRERIVVVHADGSRSLPTEVTLSPASSVYEAHTLRLLGRFGDDAPRRVELIAPIYTRDGQSLLGAAATPTRAQDSDRVVDARLLDNVKASAESSCEPTQHAIRLRYSDRLAAVALVELERIGIMGRDGSRRPPLALGDHQAVLPPPSTPPPSATAPGTRAAKSKRSPPALVTHDAEVTEAAPSAPTPPQVRWSELDDNVLVLCVAEGSEPVTVELPAGILTDRHGTPTQYQRVLLLPDSAPEGMGEPQAGRQASDRSVTRQRGASVHVERWMAVAAI